MRINFIREEEYWIYPLSGIGVLAATLFLYAGIVRIRIISGLMGLVILAFITYIIRKNYSKRLAIRFLIVNLLTIALITIGLFALTN